MQLYMITNRRLFAGGPEQARSALLDHALAWVQAGLNFIQLREKDLPWADLQQMAVDLRDAAAAMAHRHGLVPPALLINVNDEQQIQVACRVADGVHLPGDARSLTTRVREVRTLWLAQHTRSPVISVACHTVAEVEEARTAGISAILFAPVFEKPVWEVAAPLPHGALAGPGPGLGLAPAARLEARRPGIGLEALRTACLAAGPVPVYALGGVTLENAGECLAAGAAGIAGIRLFVGDGWRRRLMEC